MNLIPNERYSLSTTCYATPLSPHLLNNINNDPVTKILRLLCPQSRQLHRFGARGFGKRSQLAQYLILGLIKEH